MNFCPYNIRVDWKGEKNRAPRYYPIRTNLNCVSEEETSTSISRGTVNILFNPSTITKKDVWEIDLIKILDILIKILEKSGKKDLRVAGMAAFHLH